MTTPNELIAVLRPLVARINPNARAVKHKGKSPTCERAPIDDECLAHHVNGGPAYGGYPITPGKDTTEIACLDFDSHKGEATWEEMRVCALAVFETLEADGHRPQPFRSSGGNGIHLILLWKAPQDAYSVRAYLESVLAKHGLKNGTKGIKANQVEIFPKQNVVKPGEFGNMFVLPLAFHSVPLDCLELEPLPKAEAKHIRWRSSQDVPKREREAKAKPRIELTETDITMLRSALAGINNDGQGLDYDTWRNVIFAIHHATLGGAEGFELAVEFSERSSKFSLEFFEERVWPYIKLSHEGENGPITINTIFALAREHGWREPPELDFAEWSEDFEARLEEALLDEDGEEYPEPLDLWKSQPAPAWQRHLAPEIISTFAYDRAEIANHDPKGYAAMAVAAAAAAVPLHVTVQPKRNDPHWQTPLIFWSLLSGDSGEGKTPMLGAAFRPIEDHNRRLIDRYRMEIATWEADCAATPRGQPKPPRPPMRRRLVQDVTIEKLGHIMSEDNTGIALMSDELVSFLNAIGQYKSGKNSERGTWLSAYNGKAYTIDRVGRGSLFVNKWGPSIAGGIQPSRLEEAAQDAVHDGMLPRFCMAKLQEQDRVKGPGDPGAVHAYKTVIDKLLTLSPLSLKFSEEGQALYDAAMSFSSALSKGLEETQPGVSYHMQKAGFIVARLAATFHLLRWAADEEGDDFLDEGPGAEISAATAEMAIAYFNWNVRQQIPVYGEMGWSSPGVALAKQAAAFILAHKKTQPSKRDFQMGIKAWRGALPQEHRAAVAYLNSSGWLVRDIGRSRKGREGTGFSQSTKWETNPKVFERFADFAEREIARRKEVTEMLAELMRASKANVV